MDDFMENPNLKWMMTGGTPILGNLHLVVDRPYQPATGMILQVETLGSVRVKAQMLLEFITNFDWAEF